MVNPESTTRESPAAKRGGRGTCVKLEDCRHYPKVFLHTGDCFLAVRPTVVTTVLGSCVAVTMTDSRTGFGCICHAFLPDSGGNGVKDEPQPCRFVNLAMENMLASMQRLGVNSRGLTVKIFGGAGGLSGNAVHDTFYVGQRNVVAVEEFLAGRGIPLAAMDVGGEHGRKIHFLTHPGHVWVKRLQRLSSSLAASAKAGRDRRKGSRA